MRSIAFSVLLGTLLASCSDEPDERPPLAAPARASGVASDPTKNFAIQSPDSRFKAEFSAESVHLLLELAGGPVEIVSTLNDPSVLTAEDRATVAEADAFVTFDFNRVMAIAQQPAAGKDVNEDHCRRSGSNRCTFRMCVEMEPTGNCTLDYNGNVVVVPLSVLVAQAENLSVKPTTPNDGCTLPRREGKSYRTFSASAELGASFPELFVAGERYAGFAMFCREFIQTGSGGTTPH